MEKKILCVDDEPLILNVLRALFSTQGYTVHCTSSPDEALELLEREPIGLCFFDLRMPNVDGIELCRRARKMDVQARIYALSAYVEAYTEEQYREAGFDGHFRKPFGMKDLLEVCRQTLGPPSKG